MSAVLVDDAPAVPGHIAHGLEGEIAEVCGLLNATTARLVELIARVLATGAWMGAGIHSAEQWVAWQCGVSPRRARALVAMANRLPELPSTATAFTAGELSEDQVRVVCRHTQPHNDAEVAELARHATVTQLQRTLRDHRPSPDPEPVDADGQPPPPEPRRLTFGYDDDNSWSLHLTAPTDEGALIERALTDARQDLFAAADDDEARHQITWLDALLLICERSLDGTAHVRPRRDRYLTLLHLRHHPISDPVAHLHGGPALPDSLRRYLTCDGLLRPVHEVGGVPVNVGRTQRTVPDRTRTVIEDRDRGCRIPGCTRHRFLHIHHITHWEDGGPTDTDNLIALCPRHHRQHHQGVLGITGNADDPHGIAFTDHRGRPLLGAGRPTPPTDPPAEAAQRLHITPGRYTHPTGERLDTRWISFSDPPSR